MTAIMAYKNGKHIMLGVDGVSTYLDEFKSRINVEDLIATKVRHVKGSPNCLLALTGAVKGIDVIRGADNLLDGHQQVSFNYMVNTFVPRLFDLEARNNVLVKKDDKTTLDCSGILTTKNKIYVFFQSGLVMEIDDVMFRGSGDTNLCFAYHSYKDKYQDLDLMRICFYETIKNHGQIGYPVVIFDNFGKEYRYENEEEILKGIK